MVNRRKMDVVWLPIFIASASVAFLFAGRWINTNTSRYSAEAAKFERTVAETVQNDRGETQMELKNAEEKVQLALQIAERAIAERNAMEAQLKEVEGKARLKQLVKQSADLAPSERNILETQLRQAEGKAQLLQLVQQSEVLAPSERSALEAQLKQTEGKARLAQQNADLAAAQRNALELQLKRVEDELKLARKTAEKGATQTVAEDAGIPKRESTTERGTLPANQIKAGRALPLDSRQNADPVISTQPLMSPVSSGNH